MQCASCGSARVYPSRLKNVMERLRHSVTGKRPLRCRDCDWRQWREVVVHEGQAPVRPDDLRTGRRAPDVSLADLERIDSARQS